MPAADVDRLSEPEQIECLFYCGYTGLNRTAALTGGWPASFETALVVQVALRDLRGPACTKARQILVTLNKIDNIIGNDAIERLAAEQLGNLKLRSAKAGESEMSALWAQRFQWVKVLCDFLGIAPYQYSALYGTESSSISIPVRRR